MSARCAMMIGAVFASAGRVADVKNVLKILKEAGRIRDEVEWIFVKWIINFSKTKDAAPIKIQAVHVRPEKKSAFSPFSRIPSRMRFAAVLPRDRRAIFSSARDMLCFGL